MPIQRIFIKPDRAMKELEKIQQGTLLLLPRQEFEDRLERIRLEQRERNQKPQLTRAHYSAELIDRCLVSTQRAQWTIRYAGTSGSILPIEPFNLALSNLKWEHGADAILGELDGKSLGLLVKHTGKATCLFDWSARGTVGHEGIAFNLAIPPCPITTLEIKLPANSWLTASPIAARSGDRAATMERGTIVVTGPHEAGSANKRLWKIQVTGSKSIEFSIRTVVESNGVAPILFARTQNTQQLWPDRLAVDHEYQLDILQGSVRELKLDGDASLQPYAVLLPGGEVKDWHWQDNAAPKDAKGNTVPGASGLLTIQFDQPMHGKIHGLRVRSLVARSPAGLWTSPALRVRNAYSRGETLEVRLHPDLRVGKWDHGTFQPTHIATEVDGAQKLTLTDTAADPASSRRPSLILPVKGVDLHTTEKYLWQINPGGATLSAEIQYALARGNLFELRIKLPKAIAGYQIESLETQPTDLLRDWHPEGDVLVVELKRCLTPAKKAILKLQLRSGIHETTTGNRILHFPELQPMDATKRAGSLSIVVEPILRARLVSSSVPLAPAEDAGSDPRLPSPSYRFTFRDQLLSAAVQLSPQSVQVQLHGKHTLILSEHKAALRFHWEVQPLVGAPQFLDFRFGAGFPSAWKVNSADGSLRIHHWERLPLQDALPHLLQLGSANLWHTAALESMLPAGSTWRFHLSEPLQKKSTFTLEANALAGHTEEEWRRISLLPGNANPWARRTGAQSDPMLSKSAGMNFWSVPLMTPVQRVNVDQEFSLESPDEPIDKIANDGSFKLPAGADRPEKSPTQAFLRHVGSSEIEPATRITLWTRPEKRALSRLELCDEANLGTHVGMDGRTYLRVQFRLWHWHDRTCELLFPVGFQVLSVKVQDQGLPDAAIDESQGKIRLTLPFDQNGAFTRYEIVARAEPNQSFLPGLMTIAVPTIGWPITPAEIRTRLSVENGWVPLSDTLLRPVGVPDRIGRQSETSRRLRQIWDWGRSWWPGDEQGELLETLKSQKQIVLSAEAQMRAGAGKTMRLSDAFEKLAFQQLKDQVPLVIDQLAVRALGLTPETSFARTERPCWETLGLVYLPCPSGALLTSARRLESLGITTPLQARNLDKAIQEAILHGRDASAGFYLVPTWLKLPPAETRLFPSEPTAQQLGHIPSITEWEILTQGQHADRFFVVDPFVARVVGWMFAVLMGLVFWWVRRAADLIVCFRIYVFLLCVSILTIIWSPTNVREFFFFPVLFVELAAFLFCMLAFIGKRGAPVPGGKSTISHPKATAAIVAFVLLGASWSISAQPSASRTFTVFVIDGPKPTVLVTPDLLAKLDEVEKQPTPGAPGAVLLSAKYVGKAKETQATFDVQYEVHSFDDKANLFIPLSGVQLSEGAFLDGAPVFPAPHKGGYLLPIHGKGPHHLRLAFTDRAVLENEQFTLAFKVPKLAQNEITLQWQTPVQAVYCQHSWGEEKSLTDPRQGVKEWHAQLGYENVVDLRWTNAVPSSKGIEVHEAHFWDLRPNTITLTTSLTYSIGKGNLAQLLVTLPEGLFVRNVETLTASAQTALALPISIKHWSILGTGEQRRLLVDLAQPVSGNITLNLEMVPQAFPQKNKLVLPLPGPQQGKSVSGILGYRMDAAEIRETAQNLAVQSINGDDFAQRWKKQNSQAVPTVTRAYNFQRKATKAWLELAVQSDDRQAQFHLQWKVDHHHADLEGDFTISSSQDDLIFLEFFIDKSMTLVDVAGLDVRRWTLQDTLLQVWLRQPRKEATLKITGWRSSPVKDTVKTFTLPCVYPLQTQVHAATLEIRPAPGIQVKMESGKSLRPKPSESLQFIIDKAPYEASFKVSAAAKLPEATMLTKIQRAEPGMEIWHGIRLITERGQLPMLTLHLKDWPYEPLTLDAPGAIVQPIVNKALKHPAWSLKYPPGLPQEVVITLRGRVGQDKSAKISLPIVELEAATIRHRWLAWKDVDIVRADTGKKLEPEKFAKTVVVPNRSDEWTRDIASWNFSQSGSSLQAVLPKTAARTIVRIIASAESSHLTAESRWLHETSYWVHAPEATDLRIKFPAVVETFSVWTDHRLHSALQPAATELRLPLEASPLPRLVQLHWRYAEQAEPPNAPSIAVVQIDQAALPAHERIVWIPAGMTAAKAELAPTLLPRLLNEAQNHMHLTAALAQEPTLSREALKLIAARQQNFYACMRQAEYVLAIQKNLLADFDTTFWSERMTQLQRANITLAQEGLYDVQRKAAEKTTKVAPTEESLPAGVPLLLTSNLPTVSLQSEQSRISSARRTRSELFLLGAIFLLVFSYFRHGWSVLRLASPELAIALVVGMMGLYGLSLVGMVFIAALALLRCFWVLAALKRRNVSQAIAANAKQPADPQLPSSGERPT